MNRISAVASAVNYEIKRQIKSIETKEKIIQETRGWSEGRGRAPPRGRGLSHRKSFRVRANPGNQRTAGARAAANGSRVRDAPVWERKPDALHKPACALPPRFSLQHFRARRALEAGQPAADRRGDCGVEQR